MNSVIFLRFVKFAKRRPGLQNVAQVPSTDSIDYKSFQWACHSAELPDINLDALFHYSKLPISGVSFSGIFA